MRVSKFEYLISTGYRAQFTRRADRAQPLASSKGDDKSRSPTSSVEQYERTRIMYLTSLGIQPRAYHREINHLHAFSKAEEYPSGLVDSISKLTLNLR